MTSVEKTNNRVNPVESTINYVNNFILGDEISVCANIRYGPLDVSLYTGVQCRLIVKRIA